MPHKTRPRAGRPQPDAEIPVVGAREPCPCGSGKRYKSCHGRDAARAARRLVVRPFEGLPDEAQWIALREVVPAATAPLKLAGQHAGRNVVLATVLPMALPALVRQDGTVLLGLQVLTSSGDASADLATALMQALDAEPGTPIATLPERRETRLQDLVDLQAGLTVEVHRGFDFWVEPGEADEPEVAASLERANEAAVPTEPVPGLEAGYWCLIGGRTQLRWVLPQPEDPTLDALARLHAAGEVSLGEGTRFLGTFRADGLLVPVWDLPAGWTAEQVAAPAQQWQERYTAALGATGSLSVDQRRSRASLQNRQLTLR